MNRAQLADTVVTMRVLIADLVKSLSTSFSIVSDLKRNIPSNHENQLKILSNLKTTLKQDLTDLKDLVNLLE